MVTLILLLLHFHTSDLHEAANMVFLKFMSDHVISSAKAFRTFPLLSEWNSNSSVWATTPYVDRLFLDFLISYLSSPLAFLHSPGPSTVFPAMRSSSPGWSIWSSICPRLLSWPPQPKIGLHITLSSTLFFSFIATLKFVTLHSFVFLLVYCL